MAVGKRSPQRRKERRGRAENCKNAPLPNADDRPMTDDIKSRVLQRLVEDLIAAHGDNLVSITLYGSTAVEDTGGDRAHHNVLVVLRRIGLEDLRRSIEPLRLWTKARQPMPVYFSLDELQRAADVFPIEFLQMQKVRQVLHGSDPLELVETSDANLRHQLEYELRTKFLQLRRLYFPAAQSAEKISALMVESLPSFAALFRAVLMLRGEEVPVAKGDAVHAVANVLSLDVTPFDRILELSNSPRAKLSEAEANNIFDAYLSQLERVIDAVDQISSTGS